MQKVKMTLGVAIATAGALLSVPVLSRQWTGSDLTITTVAILAHSMFGLLDVFRPIIVRRAIADRSFATLANILVPSVVFGAILFVIIGVLGIIFSDARYFPLVMAISVSTLIFCSYSPFWALMESALRMGDAYLIRSVSVGMLYVVSAVSSIFDQIGFVYAGLVGVNVAAGLAFWLIGRRSLVEGGLSLKRGYLKQARHLGIQNVAKLVNDFGDRLVSSILFPVSVSGSYNISSDIAARINVPAQLAASYYYPLVCAHPEKRREFLSLGLAFSCAVNIGCLSFYVWGYGAYELYFGPGREEFYPAFSALLLIFGCYSLSFFGQTLLRSMSLDRAVTFSFVVPTLCGMIFVIWSAFIDQLTLVSVVVAAMIFKSSCIFLMAGLFREFRVYSAIGIVNIVVVYAFIYAVVI